MEKSRPKKTRPLDRSQLDRLAQLPLRWSKLKSDAALREAIVSAAARLLRAQRVVLVLQPDNAAPLIAASKLPAGESAEALLQAVTPWLTEALSSRTSCLRHGPAGAARSDQRSCLLAPLLAPQGPLGCLYADVDGAHGRFEDAERELLAMLAAMAGVALAHRSELAAVAQQARAASAEVAVAQAGQAAAAEVLQLIGSSGADTGPVFDKILESCERLFASASITLFLVNDAGQVEFERMRWTAAGRAQFGEAGTAAITAGMRATYPVPLAGTFAEQVFARGDVLDHHDLLNNPDVPPYLRAAVQRLGIDCSNLTAPLLWEGRGIGTLGVTRDIGDAFSDSAGFSPREHALLKTFATQAVIAIQNARLFNETQEALERQTASTEVLQVINASPGDLNPVFDTIAGNATRLCEADGGGLWLVQGQVARARGGCSATGLRGGWTGYLAGTYRWNICWAANR